jgi:hypothetical protein
MKAPTLVAVPRHRGTEFSNPFPSSGESGANSISWITVCADDEALAAGRNITPSKSAATASGCPPAANLRTIRSGVGTAIGFGKPKASTAYLPNHG